LLFASVRNQRLGVRAHQYIAIGTPLVANGTLVNLLARYLIPRITTSNIPPLDQRPFVDLNAPFIYLFIYFMQYPWCILQQMSSLFQQDIHSPNRVKCMITKNTIH
jgi:hypothetical protein